MVREFRNSDHAAILEVYRAAFAGPPWYEVLSEAEVAHRWVVSLTKSGFSCLVAEEERKIIGATWWDMPTIDALRQERGAALAAFAMGPIPISPRLSWHSVGTAWLRETVVAPKHQGRGVARNLKEYALGTMWYSRTPLVLTRMRDDNTAIIRLNETLGFQRTGIRVPSSQKPGIMHEYWYLMITSSGEPYLSG